MQDFELLRNVTIGQYIPTGSPVHRLDPRAKILSASLLVLAVSFNTSIVANLLYLGLVLVVALVARIPLRYMLRGLIMAMPVLVFIFFMQIFFLGWNEPAGEVYFQWGWMRITRNSLHLMIISLLRIISFIFLTSLITMTSTTTELTHGVELLLEPFRRFGIPSHELALMFTIALRFVPTLAEELERIMKAQASRGGEFGTVRMWQPTQLARSYLPLIVPLFLSAFPACGGACVGHGGALLCQRRQAHAYVVLKARPIDHVVTAASFAILLVMNFYPFPPIREIAGAVGH